MNLLDAASLVKRSRDQRKLGLSPTQGLQTISEYFRDTYLPSILQKNKSWATSQYLFNTHIEPVIGDLRCCEITEIDLHRLVEGLKPSPRCRRGITQLRDSSKNRVIALVQALFSKLVLWKVIDVNPALALKLLPEHNKRDRILHKDEYDAFFTALQKRPEPFRQFVKLLILTAMRSSEAFQCRLDFVDFDRKEIRIPKELAKGKRVRIINLSDDALDICQQIRATSRSDYLFPGRNGGHMKRPTRQLKALLADAGLEGLWLHDLRRTAASLMAETAPIHVVQKHLGHSQSSVTERYLVTTDKNLHDGVESVAQTLKLDKWK